MAVHGQYTGTLDQGINGADQIVGYYTDSSGTHGFLDSGGVYTTLDDPLAPGGLPTTAQGINATGQIVGFYYDGSGTAHGYLYSGGVYTTLDDPLATPGSPFAFGGTFAQGINASGEVVGYYWNGSGNHGFIESGGVYTTLNDPLATGDTIARGINNAGQVVGTYTDGSGTHGFIESGGVYTTLNDPLVVAGGAGTVAWGINDAGQAVGYYQDSSGLHGFLATPPVPAPVMLDAVTAKNLTTTLSGTAEANSSVSIFDGTKLIGTVTAATDGTWSLKANVTGNVVHSFTETSIDGSGQTASSAGVTLFSQASKQSLQGGSGDDVLIGAPNDILKGDGGSDTFVFNPKFGKETINDLNVNQDVIAFDHNLFANPTAAQVLSQTHDSSAGAVIVVDAQDTVTLTGVTVAQLQSHQSDFHFF